MARVVPMRILPTLTLAVFSCVTYASGFQLLEQNASGIGNAYAGSAALADNASTIYFNPAGMTQLQAREVSGGLAIVRPSFTFSNSGSSVGSVLGATGNGGDAGGWATIPNGYASLALTKDLYAGIGFGAPFGLKTDYDDQWIGAAQATMFEVKTYNVNPSVAYRVNDKVSLGAGINWQRLEATYKRVAATVAPTTPIKLTLDDDSWGWNIGALFSVSPSTRLGISYRSAIKHDTTGLLDVNSGGAGTVAAIAGIKLPGTAIFSVTQQLSDSWQMLGDVSWTGWSSIPKVDIIRATNGSLAQVLDTNFRDTWRVAVGATYKYNDTWKLKYGVAYDQTPVKTAATRLVSMPDNDRIWLSLGAQWEPNKTSKLDLGVSYIYIRDSTVDNNQSTFLRGRVAGEYSGNIWILGAQYSMSF